MTVDDAYEVVVDNLPYKSQIGAFYGTLGGQTLGAGLFYDNVRQPAFDKTSRLFKTVRGPVYVMTHECDVAQSNNRPFNDSVLVCPLIPFELFFEEYKGLPNLRAFLGEVATRDVYRVTYVPGFGSYACGGILYLNKSCSTDISAFDESAVKCIGALSTMGLQEVDAAIQNLLLREKADQLTDYLSR